MTIPREDFTKLKRDFKPHHLAKPGGAVTLALSTAALYMAYQTTWWVMFALFACSWVSLMITVPAMRVHGVLNILEKEEPKSTERVKQLFETRAFYAVMPQLYSTVSLFMTMDLAYMTDLDRSSVFMINMTTTAIVSVIGLEQKEAEIIQKLSKLYINLQMVRTMVLVSAFNTAIVYPVFKDLFTS